MGAPSIPIYLIQNLRVSLQQFRQIREQLLNRLQTTFSLEVTGLLQDGCRDAISAEIFD